MKRCRKSYTRKYRDYPLSSFPFSSSTRIPDRDKQLEAEFAFKAIALEAENKLRDQEHEEKMGQIEINKLEAASPDAFVRRARPTTLWICNFALAYVFLVHPLACWAAAIWRPGLTPPGLPDAEYLFIVLGALLGFGGFRSWEKWKGVAR
jgi:hypothetical protein